MPSHDPTMMLVAMGALFTLAIGITALFRFRRRSAVDTTEEMRMEADRKLQEDRFRADQVRAKREFEQAVSDRRLLPDGRIPCQASSQCTCAATCPAPLVVRDRGFGNFLRTRFGAVDRYRMIEETAPSWVGLVHLFGGVAVWTPRRPVQYCEVHIHVARQVCVAQLAKDEQERQESDKRREVNLATFEARGMLQEVQSLVHASEAPPAPPTPPATDPKPRKSRKPSASKAAPSLPPFSQPMRANGSNGTSKGQVS